MNLREIGVRYRLPTFDQKDVDPGVFSLAPLVAVGRSTGFVNKGNTI